MEQKTLEQIIQDVKDALNKAILELDPVRNNYTLDTREQAEDLSYQLKELLTITPLMSPEEYQEIMSSDDYYDSSC